jgi:hypothetical protein
VFFQTINKIFFLRISSSNGSLYSNNQAAVNLQFPGSVCGMQDQTMVLNFKTDETTNCKCVSQETDLTTDHMNGERCSIESNFYIGRRDFENN